MPPSVQGWTDDVTLYDYDPDEARAAARADRAGAADHHRLLVPGRRVAPVHAGSTAHRRGLRLRSRDRSASTSTCSRRRGRRTTSTPCSAARPPCTCSARPATSATRRPSSGRSSAPTARSGGSTTPSCASARGRPADHRPGRAHRRLRGDQPDDHGLPSRACPSPTRRPTSPSAPTSTASSPAPSTTEQFATVSIED